MAKTVVPIFSWLPDGVLPKLSAEFPEMEFVDCQEPAALERHLPQATLTYGVPPLSSLGNAPKLRWIQLISAGVPQDLCPIAKAREIVVTNLAGLYGPPIAEHALSMMTILARNLHVVLRNQLQKRWDREVHWTMKDLRGRTLAIVGVGNIGQSIARLATAYGMRVVGCRRTDQPTPYVDRIYPCKEMKAMLAEGDYVAVAAPLTRHTEGLLGAEEFAAMKRGVVYINVSRGAVAQEPALLAALQSGQVSAAGLDVFSTEPLPPEHPLWSMPQVIVSPHYCGDTVNDSAQPAQRFARNLHAWLSNQPLEGLVNCEWGY